MVPKFFSMALSTEQVADLTTLQQLSTHFVNILDKEAGISADSRQLSEENITKINTVYGKTIDVIEDILDTQITPP